MPPHSGHLNSTDVKTATHNPLLVAITAFLLTMLIGTQSVMRFHHHGCGGEVCSVLSHSHHSGHHTHPCNDSGDCPVKQPEAVTAPKIDISHLAKLTSSHLCCAEPPCPLFSGYHTPDIMASSVVVPTKTGSERGSTVGPELLRGPPTWF